MTVSKIIFLLLVISFLGCTSTPVVEYSPFVGVPRDKPIKVIAFKGVASNELSTTSIGQYLLTGAAIGGAAGVEAGFETGLELTGGDCGEFFIVCLALVPVFGVIGTSMGAIVSGVAGLAEKLPDSTVNSMQAIIDEYFENQPINSRLTDTFIDKSSYKWQVNDNAKTTIVLAVIAIQAINETGDKVAFSFTAAMSVDYSGGSSHKTKPFHVTQKTNAYEIEDWVNGGQDLFTGEVNQILTKSSKIFIKLLEQKI
ncbi:hypothetical protein [Pseudoalteromonas sp. T1lg48]|uniref:hypothetical protein n=1 Tax=Pseudoalteromonas sp. T1lg48 TaxID=2077100 RepID=UPI001319C9FC|nr:hypothetical protein [Pseudoalteromonas sp. T1lg48]